MKGGKEKREKNRSKKYFYLKKRCFQLERWVVRKLPRRPVIPTRKREASGKKAVLEMFIWSHDKDEYNNQSPKIAASIQGTASSGEDLLPLNKICSNSPTSEESGST